MSELRDEFHHQRFDFVHAELDAAFTFLNVARTEKRAGNFERLDRNFALALQALDQASHRFNESNREDNPQAFDSAAAKLSKLKLLIEQFPDQPA